MEALNNYLIQGHRAKENSIRLTTVFTCLYIQIDFADIFSLFLLVKIFYFMYTT